MGALLYDASLLHHHNKIRIDHRGETMRYHQDGLVRHQTMQALLDRMLTLRIGKGGSLVKEQYRRILEEGSRQSYPLLLPH